MNPGPFVGVDMRVVSDLDVGQDGGAGVADSHLDGSVNRRSSLKVAQKQAPVQGYVRNLKMIEQF